MNENYKIQSDQRKGAKPMNEIKCPECGEFFAIDESSYANIVKQVHDKEFETSVQNKLKDLEEKNNLTFEIEKNKIESEYKEKIQTLEKSNIKQIQALEKEKEARDQVIDRLKNMQSQLSTKMVGESLEQHCEIEFNKIRATAFPRKIDFLVGIHKVIKLICKSYSFLFIPVLFIEK